VNQAEAFFENWSRVWRGAESDPELYMELLHPSCPLINPINEIRRKDLPGFMEAVLEMEPDIRVVPTRWAETDDGVLIEWVNTGTLNGEPFELSGADRYTLRDGRGSEGHSYFDPRPLLGVQAAERQT
jgi:SnoaL-like domain